MARTFEPDYEDVIRKKIRDLIRTRAGNDGVSVDEIELGSHQNVKHWKQQGIYVLRPDYEGEPGPTGRNSGRFRLPVLCRANAFIHADQDDLLAQFKSLVVDTIDNNTSLDGVGGTEEAHVASVEWAKVDALPDDMVQIVTVSIRFQRSVA